MEGGGPARARAILLTSEVCAKELGRPGSTASYTQQQYIVVFKQSSDSRFTRWCWEVEDMIYYYLRSYLLEQISRNYIYYQGGCEVAPYFPAKKPFYALLK